MLDPRARLSLRHALHVLVWMLLRLELARRQQAELQGAARQALPVLRALAPGARATARLGRALGEGE